MKKQIEIKLFGLNELGVREMNEFYQLNREKYGGFIFQLGDKFGLTKKRIKNVNEFYRNGLETYLGMFDCKQALPNDGSGYYFEFRLKHFVHKVYEVEVVETFTEVSL